MTAKALLRVAVLVTAAGLAPAVLVAGTAVAGVATGDPHCYPCKFTCHEASPSRDVAGPPGMDVTSVLARSWVDRAGSASGNRALLPCRWWCSGS